MISVTRVLQWSEIFQDQSSVRVAALGIISVVICACVDDCSRWALHEPRSWISFAVTSLAYCLLFLRKVNLTIFCVFWCNYVVLAFVVPYVYFNVNVEDAISQEGGVCYGFKFNRNIRDGSGFILFALAPPEVLFASVARCLNRHCARHAAPNRMQWHQWPKTLIKWVPWLRYILCLIY